MSDSNDVNHRRELPGGGTFGYFIDTEDPDIQQAIEHKVHEAVSEVRAEYE